MKRKKAELQKPKPTVELLSTGIDVLDLAIGGGHGRGTIVNVIGDNSSGKTLEACETIAKARIHYDDTDWHFDNAEAGFAFDTKAMYGYRMLPEDDHDRSETVEDFIDNVKTKMRESKEAGRRLVYVLDSLDALTCDAELGRAKDREKAKAAGKEYTQGTYNLEKNKLMNEFFRLTTSEIEDSGTVLIIVSQTREKIGVVFGQRWRVGCEGALKFYAKQRILLKEIGKIKETVKGKEYKVGVMIKATVVKNKIAAPYKECEFEILFDYGVDNISSNLDFVFDLKTKEGALKKKVDVQFDGSSFTDKSSLVKAVEDSDLESKLLEMVKGKWTGIQDALSPKRKRKYET